MRGGRAAGAALLAVAATAWGCERREPRFTLLFFERSPAAVIGALTWAPDPSEGRLVGFDSALQPVRTIAGTWLGRPVSVSPLGSRLLVTDVLGDAVVVDTAGRLVREWSGPFAISLHAGNRAGDHVVAARSPYRVPTFLPEAPGAPLLEVLDTLGRPVEGLGEARVPTPPFLAQFVNAGALGLDQNGGIYFAPLVRDEILKYDGTGRLVWQAKRGVAYARDAEPTYASRPGPDIQVSHAAVNLALTARDDGRIYALGAADSAATRLRVDVLDARTGELLTSSVLDSGAAAVVLGPNGEVIGRTREALMRGLRFEARPPLTPAFALPNLQGDTVRLSDYAGRVALVNFWASWCDPCREEFPHMAELYRSSSREDFDIAAISDDVDAGEMLEFVQRFRPPFPILVGGGRMKATYHYRGLPYSLLLDREGRIVRRIFGFSGPQAFAELRRAIANEIAGP